jgi:aminoglycoside phosphotransferase (APT) family kinase protein
MNATAETAALTESLRSLGLAAQDEEPRYQALTGGVSSQIWRVDLRSGPVCVKRALPKLRVEREWLAPIERNHYEFAWLRVVSDIAPHAVPRLLAHDAAQNLFVMEFLSPESHPLWKTELRSGRADPAFAAQLGRLLALIHRTTAHNPAIAAEFPTDAIFHSLRLEPYLEATAVRHPDLAPALQRLVKTTATSKHALVHGDVSPKNILVGPKGPVLLDAECAWYGDPAFDLAFCLNHLLLKCLWTPAACADFLRCFDALRDAYLEGVGWEPADVLEARAAALLPALFLARVDGKSPVEYLTGADQDRVRRVARPLIQAGPERLEAIRQTWAKELENA